jgi:imidazole glycerol phosphate synthase glutamine amidotransferase subunit
MIKRAGIINYGAGNLMSITKAIKVLGLQPVILNSGKEKIDDFELLILPGVGSFGPAINTIKQNNLYEKIINFFHSKKPILGICLGIQLIFERSEEAKGVEGLKLFKGKVAKFKFKDAHLPIPHMCWNIVKFKTFIPTLLEGLSEEEYFYFVHSYYPIPEEKEIIFATAKYGDEFCAMIVKGNVVATQFHLEKSGNKGLRLLKNIINYFNKL